MNDDRFTIEADEADLEEIAGVICAQEHGHPIIDLVRSDGVLECMDDGVVADAVLPGRLGDQRLAQRTRYLVRPQVARYLADAGARP